MAEEPKQTKQPKQNPIITNRKKPGMLGRTSAVISTTLDKTESVIFESLTTVELGFQSITNTMEEFKNDSTESLLNSRLNTAKTLKQVQIEAKDLGFTEEEIQDMFTINRR